jgi:two-component system, sporulation sensor kinase E
MIEAAVSNTTVEIIIVDDRRENLMAMQAVLTDPMYTLTCLTSGEQLLQYLNNNNTGRLAVILLDVQMPGMDGFEAARLIKSRKSMQSIPIIFITAINKTEAYMEKGYSSGAIDYVFKPVNPDILRNKIRAFVQIHHYQKELERTNELLQRKTAELEMNNQKLQAAEHQLSRINLELENKIEQRTVSLRQAYQEIRESHLLFRTVFSMSPCMLAIRCLTDNCFLDINDTWTAATGYTLLEMNKQPEHYLGIKLLEEEAASSSGSTKLHRNVKVHFRTKNGEIRCGLLSEQPLQLDGSPKLLIVMMDITDQEQWEMNSARLERLHLIGEMAAAIAHEVRNPMTTVRGFLQLCKKKNDLLSEEYIDIMLEELARANSIITEFLTLAKNKTTDLKVLSLNGIVSSLLPLLQAEAIIGGRQIVTILEEIPDLRLDEKEIRQLILNIAMNGLDSMEGGGSLQIGTSFHDKEVSLRIVDEGSGIPEEILQKLGTPFFTTKEKGTGLGLAVCYSIASRHNAFITVDTGSWGSAFTIHFPV